ncbi:hypothetical protein H6503_03425 [Candidatus Woesearchaeota archaeon]|nr:hypothetical protein [Candidatus Woesearchaeota archaeon]
MADNAETKNLLVATEAGFAADANEALEKIAIDGGLSVNVVTKRAITDFLEDPELRGLLSEANALVVRSDKVTPEIMDAAPNLELVIRGGAGYNNINLDYATEKGIIVEPTPDQNSTAVAELVFGAAISSLRGIHLLDKTTKEGKFEKKRVKGRELEGKKIGIVGTGYIGEKVARRLQGWGVEIFAYDPKLTTDKAKDLGITRVNVIDEVFRDAYMVTLHIPENAHTKGVIDHEKLKLMKENGLLVNTARAGVVDYDALERILEERPGFRYAADVHPEGDIEGEKRMARYGDQVLLLPHVGASTGEANFNCATAAARQAVAYFKKGDITTAVNTDVVPYFKRDFVDLAQKLGYINAKLTDGAPEEVRIIAYDDLQEFAKPLAGNALKALFDSEITPTEALKEAKDRGIEVDIKVPNPKNKYRDTITVDYITDDAATSVRGEIDDGEMKIARIDDYKVDFEITPGIAVMFEYHDKPGMADDIGSFFTEANYNKLSARIKPQRNNGNAMFMFYVEQDGDKGRNLDVGKVEELTEMVAKTLNVYRATVLDFR